MPCHATHGICLNGFTEMSTGPMYVKIKSSMYRLFRFSVMVSS